MSTIFRARSATNTETSQQLRAQWASPGDIFSVLLIIGGDVIQAALAQLSGGKLTPVTFSFGWVAYSVSALLSAVGDNKLMPAAPDYSSIVINAANGYVRTSESWVLGRVMRDYEYWMPEALREESSRLLDGARRARPDVRTGRVGLCVSVFEATEEGGREAGVPVHDWVWFSGLGVALLQLGIASIPFGLKGEWHILVITACGTALAFASGALPQWAKEKWFCRRACSKNVVLTRGNGSQYAIVILGKGVGLDLEDLAAAEGIALPSTRYFAFLLAMLWLVLLVTAAGLKVNTWYLLGVGSIGMVQNVIVAGASRRPSAFGIHLKYRESFFRPKVMEALMDTEKQYPQVGRSLLPTFFPGDLKESETDWWGRRKRRSAEEVKPETT
ncbi:MAG: hypothetical protein M1840_005990 [Geoglossum simile]|nr:MAG: hypothetical protein M1840_005990 [Geoglossum simile]